MSETALLPHSSLAPHQRPCQPGPRGRAAGRLACGAGSAAARALPCSAPSPPARLPRSRRKLSPQALAARSRRALSPRAPAARYRRSAAFRRSAARSCRALSKRALAARSCLPSARAEQSGRPGSAPLRGSLPACAAATALLLLLLLEGRPARARPAAGRALFLFMRGSRVSWSTLGGLY